MNRVIWGKANISQTKKYSTLYMTNMSRELDGLFYFDVLDRQAREAYKPFLSAIDITQDDLQHPTKDISNLINVYKVSNKPYKGLNGEIQIELPQQISDSITQKRKNITNTESSETLAVIDFFIKNAKKVGYFFALPHDEIIKDSTNNINAEQLNIALKRGYIRTIEHTDTKGQTITELTDKNYHTNIRELEACLEDTNNLHNLPN